MNYLDFFWFKKSNRITKMNAQMFNCTQRHSKATFGGFLIHRKVTAATSCTRLTWEILCPPVANKEASPSAIEAASFSYQSLFQVTQKLHVLRENSMFNKAAVGTNSNCYNFTLTTQRKWKPVCHGTSLHNYIKTKQKWIRGWFESVNKPFGFGYYYEP